MKQYDVIVAGGGPAGVAAAIAAARNGAHTLLVEKDGYLGGAATGAGVPAFCPFTDGHKPIIRGIGLEILTAYKRAHPWRSPFFDHRPDRIEGTDWLPIEPEALKRVLDEMVAESGCDVLLHTALTGCSREGARLTQAQVFGPSGAQQVQAAVWIDCTGDAQLSAMAGCETQMGDAQGRVQAGTLCFRIANFDTEQFMAYAREQGEDGNLSQACARARADGRFPAGEVKASGIALTGPGMASLNFGHVYGLDPTDGDSMTQAEMEARRRLPEFMDFLRAYVPGAQSAVLAGSGPSIGVRESRRVMGQYVLTREDYKRRADFEDAIAYYCYPIDCHASSAGGMEEAIARYKTERYAPGERYGIPYRCLVPRGMDNLLTAGRIISCDRAMQASVRVMPACFATGQAAGTAAAMAAKSGVLTGSVGVQALRERLRKQGAYLP